MTGAETSTVARPAYATRACYLAIALTVGFGLLSLVVTATATAPPPAVAVVFAGLWLAALIVGVAAATRTLNGSNGWRIALIVFGWLTVVQAISLIANGALSEVRFARIDGNGNPVYSSLGSHTWWIGWGAAWAIGAALCSIWLARKDVVAWTKPTAPLLTAPAGWYPGPDGALHYWTGQRWATDIPPPPEPS